VRPRDREKRKEEKGREEKRRGEKRREEEKSGEKRGEEKRRGEEKERRGEEKKRKERSGEEEKRNREEKGERVFLLLSPFFPLLFLSSSSPLLLFSPLLSFHLMAVVQLGAAGLPAAGPARRMAGGTSAMLCMRAALLARAAAAPTPGRGVSAMPRTAFSDVAMDLPGRLSAK
jgi:hypothetical protein